MGCHRKGVLTMTLNVREIAEQLKEVIDKYIIRNADLILTGSWQYGTANDDSDFDLVLLYDGNVIDDVLNVGKSVDITQKTGTFKLPIPDPDIEREYDIRFMSYTSFVNKLFRADINCVEFICSPYYAGTDMNGLSSIRRVFLEHSLPDPFFQYRVLRSLMGFMSPINRKKSKKFIIPEKVNQNNLIKIANLYYLITHRYYPLNPYKGIESMVDSKGNTVELIDATSPHNNSTEIMNEVLERYNAEMESKYPDEIKYAQFPAAEEYEKVLTKIYTEKK